MLKRFYISISVLTIIVSCSSSGSNDSTNLEDQFNNYIKVNNQIFGIDSIEDIIHKILFKVYPTTENNSSSWIDNKISVILNINEQDYETIYIDSNNNNCKSENSDLTNDGNEYHLNFNYPCEIKISNDNIDALVLLIPNYIIFEESDLKSIELADSNSLEYQKQFTLANDITLTESSSEAIINEFYGQFNGNNHKISNININAPGLSSIGLIGTLKGVAKVYNLNLEVNNITAVQYVGALAGNCDSENVMIKDITVDLNTINATNYLGGLIGRITGKGNIENVKINTINDQITNLKGSSFIGGITGYLSGKVTIEKAESTIKIDGLQNIGGIVGQLNDDGNLNNSKSNSEINGDSYIGGIVGDIRDISKISNSYNNSNIIGNNYVGGIAGSMQNSSSISSSYAITDIQGEDKIGGIVGFMQDNSRINNSYVIGVLGSRNSSNEYIGGIAGQKEINATIRHTFYIGNSEDTIQKQLIVGKNENVNDMVLSSYSISNVNNSLGDIDIYSNDGTISTAIVKDGMPLDESTFTSLTWLKFYDGQYTRFYILQTSNEWIFGDNIWYQPQINVMF